MAKIKEILSRLSQNQKEYTTIRFLVAKRLFTFIVALYLVARLFTVWGFYFGDLTLADLSIITYHLYSLLVIATMFFGYAIVEYIVATSFPNKKAIILIPTALVFLILGVVALLAHIGLLTSLV